MALRRHAPIRYIPRGRISHPAPLPLRQQYGVQGRESLLGCGAKPRISAGILQSIAGGGYYDPPPVMLVARVNPTNEASNIKGL